MTAESGDWSRHKGFSRILQAAHRKSSDRLEFLEVGVWAGWSTASWIKALRKMKVDFQITAIDNWNSGYTAADIHANEHYSRMNAMANSGDIETLFRRNMSELCSFDEITILKNESNIGLRELPHGYFDCISLDANHLYDAVLEDLRLAIPLLKETGILCGDDLEIQYNDILEEFDFNSAREWEYLSSGIGFHPGVTQAVWETFGKVKAWNGLFVVGKQGQEPVNVNFPSAFQMFFARKPYSSRVQFLQLIIYRIHVLLRPKIRIKKIVNSFLKIP